MRVRAATLMRRRRFSVAATTAGEQRFAIFCKRRFDCAVGSFGHVHEQRHGCAAGGDERQAPQGSARVVVGLLREVVEHRGEDERPHAPCEGAHAE